MRKWLKSAGIGAAALGLLPLSASGGEVIDTSAMDVHKIGVVVYSLQDEQVMAFRDYLENYIGMCFPDVTFIYSGAVNDSEAEMSFLQAAIDAGVEGILSFSSYDLEAEVQLCADNQVYYLRAASSESEENLAAVEDNEYFLGCVGPGIEMEYEAGYEMGKYFAEHKESDEFFILSGGAPFGVGMHQQRTLGILDALAESYGVTFEDPEVLAASPAVTREQAGDLTVCVVPGFLDNEDFAAGAAQAYAEYPYAQVMAVVPISGLADTVAQASLGVIDCYSTQNLQLFGRGTLNYVVGKFSSTIGPSFAVMYNAVTGHAADFREDGKAFVLTQGFWTSDSREDYETKYALSCSIALNAYSVEDLMHVCCLYNPEASMEDLRELTEAYSFEDACVRRGLEE